MTDLADDVKAVSRLVEYANYKVEDAAQVVATARDRGGDYVGLLADAYYEELGASDE